MIKQVGQSPLSLAGKHRLENLPYLAARSHIFSAWLPRFSWLRQWDLS